MKISECVIEIITQQMAIYY